MPDVLLTGVGVVSPIGVGWEAVRDSLHERRSGVQTVRELADAGWVAPFGGVVADFEPKHHVKPRKSLKVMARETQLAFAAGEMAWADAGLEETAVDPERVGVLGVGGMLYCDLEELAAPFDQSFDEQRAFDLVGWGERGMRELFPLWMLKYLPNMAACHVGIRRDARGPTNTISLGEVSGLVALAEATEVIRRGAADVMLVGGASSKLDLTDLIFHAGAGLSRRAEEPAAACRPFDADRDGAVCGEGSAVFVLESRDHAERRGLGLREAKSWARVDAVANRFEPSIESRHPTGQALAQAAQAAIDSANLEPADLAFVKAHGSSRKDDDAMEAKALQETIGDAPVFAPTSYIGSVGAACGVVELATALIGLREGFVPATLNYSEPDPDCPVNLCAEERPAAGDRMMAVNYALTGQAIVAVLSRA